MQKCKQTAFINELANLMDKYDAHFVVEDDYDGVLGFYIVQNEWPAADVPYDWKTGVVNSDIIRRVIFME